MSSHYVGLHLLLPMVVAAPQPLVPDLTLMYFGSDAQTILSHGLFDALIHNQLSRIQTFKLPRSQIMRGFGNVPLSLGIHFVVPELVLRVCGTSITLRNVSA
ncbi:hypothetical protein AC1031_012484 [Aphanomyces cochlioides]|nr:hypothetical protein AC1031_012484 [Aphanomyces cochlioides]